MFSLFTNIFPFPAEADNGSMDSDYVYDPSSGVAIVVSMLLFIDFYGFFKNKKMTATLTVLMSIQISCDVTGHRINNEQSGYHDIGLLLIFIYLNGDLDSL